MVEVDWSAGIVVREGVRFPMDHHEYWIAVPSRSDWQVGDGPVGPLDFGFMLHNARIGEGVLPPLAKLSEHFESRSLKGEGALQAEQLLEARRKANYPDKPSRVSSYYLNSHRDVAEDRVAAWAWQDRRIVRCHLLTTTGTLHGALVSNFEALVADPTSEPLADRYWSEVVNEITEANRHDVEILADCGLYFPDWESFELIDRQSLIDAQAVYGSSWKQLGRT